MTAALKKHANSTWNAVFRLWRRKVNRRRGLIIGMIAVPLLAIGGVAGGFYYHFAKLTDAELRAGAFQHSVNIYAAPFQLAEGDGYSRVDLAEVLKVAGFSESDKGDAGSFRNRNGSTEIFPQGSATADPVKVTFADDKRIGKVEVGGKSVKTWSMGNPLIASLTSRDTAARGKTEREKRHPVRFDEIPPVLVNAVISAEDKRFFQHKGVDFERVLKASWVDLREGRKEQGGSTLSMQLVRGLWLRPEKKWKRKIAEIMMTLRLERKWSKQQIFEAYANQVFLGRQAAYDIHGFAEGASMLFGKQLRDLTLPEAALMAGMVQRPSYFNPYRHPDRAKERRDLVLGLMKSNHYIDDAEYNAAIETPIKLASASDREDSLGAAWFLDLLDDELQDVDRTEDSATQVYSTLDINLQRAAQEAIASGMEQVDRQFGKKNGNSQVKAEAALIAIDSHTGEIRAVVGGRNYSQSQLNHVLSKRPPGSVFKPFVYAAALNTAVEGGTRVLTPATIVDDSPDTFWFNGKPYQPSNFRGESYGPMTLRQALARSDNIAAVKIAQQVGYGSVVAMARRAGLNDNIGATPAVALGSYDVTPLEMAGAWTMFSNGGAVVKPQTIVQARNSDGDSVYDGRRGAHQALDPRVAYLMVGMLQEVMRSGTAAGVRSRGFLLPAAGKTGTSHDGWFAGFTSNLLCLVWVGFDDYRELNLEGAKSALPIWTEFMKKATRVGAYRNATEFPRPPGISSAEICRESGKLAGDLCTDVGTEIFVSGTEPREKCDLHGIQTISTSRDAVEDGLSSAVPHP